MFNFIWIIRWLYKSKGVKTVIVLYQVLPEDVTTDTVDFSLPTC